MNRARHRWKRYAPKEAELWKDGQTQRVPIESLTRDVVR